MSTEYSNHNDYCESDYEFITNSDSDADNETMYQKKLVTAKIEDTLEYRFGQTNLESFKLNLSQEMIHVNGRIRKASILSNDERSDGNEKTGDMRKFSIQPFSIVPISVMKKGGEPKGDTANLPEIVLTSFEHPDRKKSATAAVNDRKSAMRKMSGIPDKAIQMPPSAAEPSPATNLHFLRDENSPSPEMFLDTQLSAASSMSNRSSRNSIATELYDDNSMSVEKSLNLAGNSISRLRSGSSIAANVEATTPSISIDLKCRICDGLYRDPRVLDCLDSFCFDCLVEENFKQDSSIPFWSQPNQTSFEWKSTKSNFSIKSVDSGGEMSSVYHQQSPPPTRPESRSSFTSSFKSRKSNDKSRKSSIKTDKSAISAHAQEKPRNIICPTCQYLTEVPIGGIRQLPVNFILVRKVENMKMRIGNDVISKLWCSLCNVETTATYHCLTCTTNLCTYCKDAHERQRTTTNHQIRNIVDMRKLQRSQKTISDESKYVVKCAMHPGFEMKSFCISCLQVVCSDCLILLHKGHKSEPIGKAFKDYYKLLRETTDRTKPLCEYADHSIARLNEIAKRISHKCDQIQSDVESFIVAYNEAVDVHSKTLMGQIVRARETKMQMILEQQLDMEKRSTQADMAVKFSQELIDDGSEAEILSFVNVLLKRFEFCQKFQPPLDPKISDTLNFLPEIRAPSTKDQNNIPLFGIITTQVVAPQFCTLETDEYCHLRVHKNVKLIVLSRDADGLPLCHGGLTLIVKIKYKEGSAKCLPVEISDKRDGTYGISFVPDSPGNLGLSVTINDRHIKGSPFILAARSVCPHSGIFHCCAFCSSKGSKMATCACNGKMPNFNGCGHGHAGHPGRRHWSCCGNVLENSECGASNKLLSAL